MKLGEGKRGTKFASLRIVRDGNADSVSWMLERGNDTSDAEVAVALRLIAKSLAGDDSFKPAEEDEFDEFGRLKQREGEPFDDFCDRADALREKGVKYTPPLEGRMAE